MGQRYLVDMGGGPEPGKGKRKGRVASERTKRRKALGVKPTVRGGPKKNRSFSDRVAQERRAQGLPPRVEDPATLRRVADLLRFSKSETTTGEPNE